MVLKHWYYQNLIEAILGDFERKILRAIFGSTNDNAERTIKYNNELYTLYRERDIVTYTRIKINQINGQDMLFVWRNRALQEEFWLQWQEEEDRGAGRN